jgi:hypothetical protein
LSDIKFTKDNLNECLKELAKEFRKANGKHVRAEIILVGGASILVNYDFRQMTYGIDAVTYTNSAIKDVINRVGDRLGLPNGWLNADFTRTTSYTSKISQFSKYYKTFLNVLEVRTISSEYLIVMKLMSGRQYKNDLSDIIGILIEQKTWVIPLHLTESNMRQKKCMVIMIAYQNHQEILLKKYFIQMIYRVYMKN